MKEIQKTFQKHKNLFFIFFGEVALIFLLGINLGMHSREWLSPGALEQGFISFCKLIFHWIINTLKTGNLFLSIVAFLVVFVLIISFVFYKKKLKRHNYTTSLKVDLRLLNSPAILPLDLTSFVLAFLCGFVEKPSVKNQPETFGIITLCVAAIIIIGLKGILANPNSEDYVYFERHKKPLLIYATITGIILVGLPLWIPNFWGFTLPPIFENTDMLGCYIALLSLTFISISVMSVLSDRSVVIYWENIAESKLIKPIFGSFAAYTYYSVGAAIGAGISVALGNSTAFIIFGIINIFTMLLLTYTMVDVYYDRESKKVIREREFQIDAIDYLCVKTGEIPEEYNNHPHQSSKNGDLNSILDDMEVGHTRYINKTILLCQNILRARDEHDLTYLQEVYELYIRNISRFYTPDGKAVTNALFADIDDQTWPLVKRSLKSFIDDSENHKALHGHDFPITKVNALDTHFKQFSLTSAREDTDAIMWEALAKSKYLERWLLSLRSERALDHTEIMDFTKLIVQKILADYNLLITLHNCFEQEKARRLSKTPDSKPLEPNTFDQVNIKYENFTLLFETIKGEKLDAYQMENFIEKFGNIVIVTPNCFGATFRMLCVILSNLEPSLRNLVLTNLKALPLFRLFTLHLKGLGFEEKEIAFWKECFEE